MARLAAAQLAIGKMRDPPPCAGNRALINERVLRIGIDGLTDIAKTRLEDLARSLPDFWLPSHFSQVNNYGEARRT